jgi:hypothetical protein
VTDAERHFERRLDEHELRAAVAAWERGLAARPGDVAAWLMLTRARYFLADAFLVPRKDAGDKAALKELLAVHEAGADAAARGLAAGAPALARLVGQGVMKDAARQAGAAEMPLFFWWAQHTIMAAQARGTMAIIKAHEPVFRVMERVAELAPDTWYGGPARYFGVIYCTAPSVIGGSLSKGRAYFEDSLARAPGFLDTYELYARIYAQPAGDAALRQALIARALALPLDGIPEIVPEQTVARRRLEARAASGG